MGLTIPINVFILAHLPTPPSVAAGVSTHVPTLQSDNQISPCLGGAPVGDVSLVSC